MIFIINAKLVLVPTFDQKWHLKTGCGCWGRVLELHLSYRYAPAWGGYQNFLQTPAGCQPGCTHAKPAVVKFPKSCSHLIPALLYTIVFCHLHSKTIAFSSNVWGFRVCERFEAFTLWLLSPCCLDSEAIMRREGGKNANTKKEGKIGVELLIASSINYHQALAFNLLPISLFFNLSPNPNCLSFSGFVSFFFFTSHRTPFLFVFFGGEKLWTFNKFCMGSSSLVMKSINLSPNEEMVQIFVGHDNSNNVDNLSEANGKLHPTKVIPIPSVDSYVLNLNMTNLRKQAIH